MIVLVCGLPASGKTTLAVPLRQRLADRGHEFELLHSDDYERHPYDRMWERVADAAERRTGPDGGWLLDGTFFRREWRNRFYRFDDTYEVWVKASPEACLERNEGRDDPIPRRGVEAIAARFEPPRADLTVDTEALDADAALDRLEAAVREWLRD